MRIKFDQAKQKLDASVDHLKSELNSIRAGRANPDIVSNLSVEVAEYGQKMQLNQIANINVVDASLLTIQPWDKATIDDIQKAINNSDLGINPSVDGAIIRLPIPPLTQERRQEYVKLTKNKVEEARIAVRQIRKDILVGMEMDKEDKVLTEDELKSLSKQLQDLVDQANDSIEKVGKEKEGELTQV